MAGENKDEKIETIWWVHEIDLLGHESMVQHYKNFSSVADAFSFALSLKDNSEIESIEIRFI